MKPKYVTTNQIALNNTQTHEISQQNNQTKLYPPQPTTLTTPPIKNPKNSSHIYVTYIDSFIIVQLPPCLQSSYRNMTT